MKDLNWVAAANSLRITYNGQPLLYASMVNSAQAIASVVSCSLDMALNKDPFTVNPTTPPATRPVTPVDPFKDA